MFRRFTCILKFENIGLVFYYFFINMVIKGKKVEELFKFVKINFYIFLSLKVMVVKVWCYIDFSNGLGL